jgi:hypothetical protein
MPQTVSLTLSLSYSNILKKSGERARINDNIPLVILYCMLKLHSNLIPQKNEILPQP